MSKNPAATNYLEKYLEIKAILEKLQLAKK